jgi:hypothetical protein
MALHSTLSPGRVCTIRRSLTLRRLPYIRGCVWYFIRLPELLESFPISATVKLHPIVLAILYFSSIFQRLGEQIPKIVIIWRVLESKISDIAQILAELLRQSITEILDRGRLLFLSNLLTLLLIRGSLESLPR